MPTPDIHPFPITAAHLSDAYAVLAHPDARQPQSLRRWAWLALKSARGQRVSQSRLNKMGATQHIGGAA